MSLVDGLRRRRGAGWLASAVVLATAALLLALARGDDRESASVLVATGPIAPGTLIDEAFLDEQVGRVEIPSDLPLAGLLTSADVALGRRTVAGIAVGEPLTLASLGGGPGSGPRPLAPGERAAPVPLASHAAAGAGLVPGARVDVVASTGEGASGRSRVVVADAEVLAVDTGGDPAVGEPSVVLRVRAAEALRLTAATNFARDVRLLVRPALEIGSELRVGADAPAP